MDGDRQALEAKLESLLREAASIGEQLGRSERGSSGVPHFSEIEGFGHAIGRRLSRAIQRESSIEAAGRAGTCGACPGCGRNCRLEFKERTIESVDGSTDICEPVGYCPQCQRSFFPSA